jgi:ribosomal protein L23
MWAPVSVRRARFVDKKESNTAVGLQYLFRNLKRMVLSDKHIMDKNILVFDVTKNTCKQLLTRAMNSIDPANKVLKVNTLIRKSSTRSFRGVIGSFSAYKRVYVRFEKEIDPKVFSFQTEGEVV